MSDEFQDSQLKTHDFASEDDQYSILVLDRITDYGR
jgi:hypothetical protein